MWFRSFDYGCSLREVVESVIRGSGEPASGTSLALPEYTMTLLLLGRAIRGGRCAKTCPNDQYENLLSLVFTSSPNNYELLHLSIKPYIEQIIALISS